MVSYKKRRPAFSFFFVRANTSENVARSCRTVMVRKK